MGDEGAVYADRAYDTHRGGRSWSMGIGDRIMKRGNKRHPEGRIGNGTRRVRARVEKVFLGRNTGVRY